MKPAKITLSTAAQRFVSSDGALEVDVPAGISFGTYEFQFFVRIPRKCRTSALRHVIRAENHAPPETTSDQLAH